jgi:hypothetical protein
MTDRTSVGPPDFFVIGAYRSGTTSIARDLAQHPDIFLPPEKEPNFFAVDGNPDASRILRSRAITSRGAYEALYSAARSDQRRGDISPEYLRNPFVAERLRHVCPDAPLVAVLRNPIDRLWSDFLLHRRDGNEPETDLVAALADQDRRQRDGDHRAGHYLDSGMYHEQLSRYVDLFPRNQILVVLFDDLVADRPAALRHIFDHVGVDASFVPTEEDAINASGIPTNRTAAAALKYRAKLRPIVPRRLLERVRPTWDRVISRHLDRPTLSGDDRAHLVDVYRADVVALGVLLERDLSHWLEPPIRC